MPDIATISPLNPHPGYIGPPTVVWKDNFGTSRFHCHQSLGISEKIRYNVSAFFVTPPLPALSGVVASARFCCLSRVPPAVCPSLLESTTTVCTSFLQSLSTYVHTPTPHSILRFSPLHKHQIYIRPIFHFLICLLYTSPSPRDGLLSRMPSSA